MKIFKFLVCLLLGVFLVVSPVLAQDFPKPVGYVNDFANLFSSEFRQSLEQELTDFEKETTAEIAIVAINSLEGGVIEEYAVRLFEQWGIGKKEKDNGLLILIAKEDRKIRIEVGYGLEPIINDSRAGRIIRDSMTPAFREENYDQGVKLAVDQIKEYIRSGEPAQEEVGEVAKKGPPFFVFLIIGFALFIYFSSFWARSKSFWAGGLFGGIFGGILGVIIGTFLGFIFSVLGFGLFGLFLDYLLSRNYKKRKKAKKPTSFWKSWGGFSGGGGGGGGGFGGFGGGSSGGGGASGGW